MNKKNIEDLYPLSPMQQGMLFHSLFAPDSQLYVEQVSCTLRGPLDLQAFEQTWQNILERHAILRTAFYWEGLKEPVQVVHRQVNLAIEQHDWRNLPESLTGERLKDYLEQDRLKGFDLSTAPLMRLALIQTGEDVYSFVWTHHHILLDGWSIPLLLQEVFSYYEAAHHGVELNLERPRPYRDYIVWLRRQNLAEAESFWRRILAGFTNPTPLVVSNHFANTAGEDPDFTGLEVDLSAETTSAVQSLARQHQLTLNTLVQGAWALLLSRYSGEEEVVFGSTVSGRPADLAGAGGMIGLFINTLPVRVRIPPTMPVLDWLRELQTQQAELRQYEYAPLVQIQGWSEVPRGVPLFESIVVFENLPIDRSLMEAKGSVEIEINQSVSYTNYPITFVAVPDREMLFKLAYDRQRFDEGAIERMMGHLRTILDGIVADPIQPVSRLPMLTGIEKHTLLSEWNETAAFYPADKCIHQLFEAQVEQTPHAIAAVFESEQISYQALDERANQLAVYLRKLGVGPGSLVGIFVERSLEMLVGLLGILKAGGAYLPLDPSYPQDRLAYMLADAQTSLVITQGSLVASLPAPSVRVVCIDTGWPEIASGSRDRDPGGVTSDQLAYVIYTSGSTGKPKGVQIPHRAVVNFLQAMRNEPGLSRQDVLVAVTTLSFDIAALELFLPLTVGGRVVIASRAVAVEGERLSNLLAESKATVMQATPTTWQILLNSGWPGDRRLKILCGGEALPRDLAEQLLSRCSSLWNMYGPTETTIWSMVHRVQPGTGLVPIGRPVANTQCYVLDRAMQVAPIGVVGELYIGGDGLSVGYRNQPQLTAEKFVPHPFSAQPGARLYRTGDLACFLPDGNIEFLGRIDHQVKLRGYRIELGEIEAVLREHPAVKEGVVWMREEGGRKRLVAYLVPKAVERAPTAGEIREFLRARLPEYMLPAACVILEALPLTSNRKVDRRALPAPDSSRPENEQAYVAPRTPEEETLAGIWAQILGLQKVGIEDNFFELGGDSILSLQVIYRAKQAGLMLSPRQLFQHPIIRELAAVVGEEGVVQAEQGIVVGPVPLTPIQHWFFDHHPFEPHHFNTSMMLEVWNEVDLAFLEGAVKELIAHHDALRLEFQKTEAGWQQVNAGVKENTPFSCVDLSMVPEGRLPEAIKSAAARLQASFNLSEGPLLRVAYLNLGPKRTGRLLLIFHHLITDGVSWRILMEDLLNAYLQLARGEAVHLPPKTTSYQAWARRLERVAQSPDIRRELETWLKMGSREVPSLPVDFPGGANTYGVIEDVTRSLGLAETQALLQEVPAAYGAQVNEVLLAALVRVLARWTGKRAFLIDVEEHGRGGIVESVDLSRTVGWFMSSYPLLLDLGDNPEFKAELQAVKEQYRNAPSKGAGYGLLRYLCAEREVREQLAALPVPEVNFNYLGQFDQVGESIPEQVPFRLAKESAGPEQSPYASLSARLYVVGIMSGGELNLRWLYSKELYKRSTIEKLAKAYIKELRSLAASMSSNKLLATLRRVS